MYRLISKITIKRKGGKGYIFDKIASCHITYDTVQFTATCTVELPRNIKWVEGKMPLGVDDNVTVELGYDGDGTDGLKTRFIGYIVQIKQNSSLELICEDEMRSFKKQELAPFTESAIKLGDLLNNRLGKYSPLCFSPDVKIDGIRFDGNTVMLFFKQLNELKDHPISSFFRIETEKPILHVGEGNYDPQNKPIYKFAKGVNIITDDTAEGQDGKLTGSFTTFGIPEVDIYDHIYFQPDFDEVSGKTFIVKKVTVAFVANDVKTNGYRQTITLGDKVS